MRMSPKFVFRRTRVQIWTRRSYSDTRLIHTCRAVPCRAPAVHRRCRVLRESPRGSRKKPKLVRPPTCRRETADVNSHIPWRAVSWPEKSLAERHGVCKLADIVEACLSFFRNLPCQYFELYYFLFLIFSSPPLVIYISDRLPGDTRWTGWLRHCATNRKVAGSIPDGVTGIFQWLNPSGRFVALGSTQPLTEMSTRNPSWG
jgi:hypothetical protein